MMFQQKFVYHNGEIVEWKGTLPFSFDSAYFRFFDAQNKITGVSVSTGNGRKRFAGLGSYYSEEAGEGVSFTHNRESLGDDVLVSLLDGRVAEEALACLKGKKTALVWDLHSG